MPDLNPTPSESPRQLSLWSPGDLPLPLLVAARWQFDLQHHIIDNRYWYSPLDWIAGLIGRKSANQSWKNIQRENEGVFSKHQLPYIATDGKTYQVDFVTDKGLYWITQHLRLRKGRPALGTIRDYLSAAGAFVDAARRDPEAAIAILERQRQLKRQQNVVAYQLHGRPEDWAEQRVYAKDTQKLLFATATETHEERKPNYGGIAAAQNQGLFDMTRREIIAYLGLLPAQEGQYRDFLGKYAQMAVSASNNLIVDRMKKLGRDLTGDEQTEIVRHVTRLVAPTMRQWAEYAEVDYISGADLDERGNPLITRNVKLLPG